MTAVEEKPEVEHTTDAKTSSSLKEKDVETPAATSYIPQSDEEYVVTLKTWCVVMVQPLKLSSVLRFQLTGDRSSLCPMA
jgi:hypothetical protein